MESKRIQTESHKPIATSRTLWSSMVRSKPFRDHWLLRVLSCSNNCASSILSTQSVSQRPVSMRSEEHTSELQSLMRISYAVFCLKNKKTTKNMTSQTTQHQHNI